jgi:hypothetical protein
MRERAAQKCSAGGIKMALDEPAQAIESRHRLARKLLELQRPLVRTDHVGLRNGGTAVADEGRNSDGAPDVTAWQCAVGPARVSGRVCPWAGVTRRSCCGMLRAGAPLSRT